MSLLYIMIDLIVVYNLLYQKKKLTHIHGNVLVLTRYTINRKRNTNETRIHHKLKTLCKTYTFTFVNHCLVLSFPAIIRLFLCFGGFILSIS